MSLTIRPLAETFAAEVRGVDLRKPPGAPVIREIYNAFLEHGVLVIPGQNLTIDQQLEFASTFGEVWQLPDLGGNHARRVANRGIDDVSNLATDGEVAAPDSERLQFQLGNQLWHSDLSNLPVPAHASMLHALEVCAEGGETQYADEQGAYAELSEERKAELEGLIAEHSIAHSRVLGGNKNIDVEALNRLLPPSPQPVVRVHPETGKKTLFVGAHAARIFGMDDEKGNALIRELVEFSTRPHLVYTHRWAVNDLVIWDNRRVMHRGRPFDQTVRRVMHRATINGDPTMSDSGEILIPDVRPREPRVPEFA
ncbi:TauD/TfdA dioxygenase family protein [Nocardia jinanensis]|uniref:Alpha-ketoglutarate-dependent 2,4-dichlorophenoxyacetate dioxygenase n=1 Tax=Nocardia jinanensis TaxID=382504 RepID=A0A917RAV1_9NOCA|nr:TauD/TfdA family dioxygenase [Nocardia jinanensis]GGK99076.1 alpha-ketoglutarate-dependent 2,4-dichlorophenoxyacetate dioxygenase [Nocardia jinanensis]